MRHSLSRSLTLNPACLALLLVACGEDAESDLRKDCEAARARYDEAVASSAAGEGSAALDPARRQMEAACLTMLGAPMSPQAGTPPPGQ